MEVKLVLHPRVLPLSIIKTLHHEHIYEGVHLKVHHIIGTVHGSRLRQNYLGRNNGNVVPSHEARLHEYFLSPSGTSLFISPGLDTFFALLFKIRLLFILRVLLAVIFLRSHTGGATILGLCTFLIVTLPAFPSEALRVVGCMDIVRGCVRVVTAVFQIYRTLVLYLLHKLMLFLSSFFVLWVFHKKLL